MKNGLKNTALAALFLTLGIVLPFFTSQIHFIGNMLLPMHIPVLLCGLICGWKLGLSVGFILPLLRSALFLMPVMYPNAISMAFELAIYGGLSGAIYNKFTEKSIGKLYLSIVPTMLLGRIVWGVSKAILLNASGGSLTFKMFITGGFLNAIPGIALQLILIPIIVTLIQKNKE